MIASTQPSLFPDLVPAVERRPKVPRAYDPKTDMWGQRQDCPKCGKRMFRQGAYIICHCGHEEWMECFGRPEHPRYEEFCAYRRRIGHPIDD